MRKLLLVLLTIVGAAILAQTAVASDTVYVVRHLQKADGADPALSPKGAANAQILAERLARKLRISITSYDPRDPAALIKAAAAVNGAVLIVGHSNTVPDIVARLGGTPVLLSDQDYGTVFLVKPGSPKVEQI